MKRRNHKAGYGQFLEVKVVDQFNGNDIIFSDRVRAGDREEVVRMLRRLSMKGVNVPEQKTEKKLLL